ncbi:hypothetical protein [Heliorestis convoluta]|uniref:Uncharacterized protein n=1 Tax=Heliorestis convoluta TaxID=356322 RepID=A0A5Q2MWC2_9FIRM|nr:hypothetical protein [Heliorestis convoluta]QGG46658.1 hypothetical protein FTV88_0479 [Heliorestis convoluta]
MSELTKDKLKERLQQEASKQAITCEKARALAEELQIPYDQIGAMADELGIKIRACQLGCF